MWNHRSGVYDPHESGQEDKLAGVPLASFGSRFAAYTIDLLVGALIVFPIEVARQYLWSRYRNGHAPEHIDVEVNFHNPWAFVWLVLYWGLCTWATNGLTVGKWLLRIRVVSLEHEKVSLWQGIERALGYGASTLEGGFGFLQYFLHRNHCCVHDRIAGTIVVKKRRRGKDGIAVGISESDA
jgi:uncharacterized RDD family membrane protein YckC